MSFFRFIGWVFLSMGLIGLVFVITRTHDPTLTSFLATLLSMFIGVFTLMGTK